MRVLPGVFASILLIASFSGYSQTAGSAAGAPPAAASQGIGIGGSSVATKEMQTDKQRALVKQTEQLFDMATELKVQVDKTNKNILSMKVVQKAEEIEMMAKGMKGQAKR